MTSDEVLANATFNGICPSCPLPHPFQLVEFNVTRALDEMNSRYQKEQLQAEAIKRDVAYSYMNYASQVKNAIASYGSQMQRLSSNCVRSHCSVQRLKPDFFNLEGARYRPFSASLLGLDHRTSMNYEYHKGQSIAPASFDLFTCQRDCQLPLRSFPSHWKLFPPHFPMSSHVTD